MAVLKMITKLSTYRFKMVFTSILLLGTLASINSCQHELTPVGANVSKVTKLIKYEIIC